MDITFISNLQKPDNDSCWLLPARSSLRTFFIPGKRSVPCEDASQLQHKRSNEHLAELLVHDSAGQEDKNSDPAL